MSTKWHHYEITVKSTTLNIPIFRSWLYANDDDHAKRLGLMEAGAKGWPTSEAVVTVQRMMK